MTAPNLDPLSTVPTDNAAAGQKLLQDQQNQIGGFNTAFQNFVTDPKNNLSTIASGLNDQFNVPALQANANTLQNQLLQMPQTYRQGTMGYDVNNNQLSRVIAQRMTDLGPVAEAAQNSANTAQGQVNTRLGYAQQNIQNQLLPYQSQQALMQDQMARQATMFTTSNQQELDGLIAKINAGVTLSNAEADRANQLSIAEKGYQNALDVAKQNQKYIPIMGYGVYDTTANNGAGQLMGGLNGTGSNQLIKYTGK